VGDQSRVFGTGGFPHGGLRFSFNLSAIQNLMSADFALWFAADWCIVSGCMAGDPEHERQRLARHYASLSNGELLAIGANLHALTDVAREAITAELAKRGLKAEHGADEERRFPALGRSPDSRGEASERRSKDAESPRESFLQRLLGRGRPDLAAYLNDDVAPTPSGAAIPPSILNDTVLVTAARFLDLPRALVVRGAMSSAEIGCVLCDTELARTDWLWTNLIGWLRLQVHPQDLPEAMAIVHQSIPERFEVPGVGEYEQPACPKCKSLDVNYQENAPLAYIGLYFALPIPAVRKGWRCHNCKNEWPNGSDAYGETLS
jgi:hypothetical protein